MRSSFLDYAMSVIVSRALPDVRDGLKPVHRRILYAMHETGLQPNRPRVKCARVVGDVMGNYHPHGDAADLRHARPPGAALLDALPAGRRPGQLRQHRRRIPPAAMRYTEARLAAHRDRDAARHRRGHGRLRAELRRVAARAAVLPSRFPNLLVNGSPGSRSAWRRTCRRTTSARSIDALVAMIDDPDDRRRAADAAHQGPGLPDRRHHPRPRRDPRGVPLGPRPRSSCARAPTSRSCAAARPRSSSPSSPTA